MLKEARNEAQLTQEELADRDWNQKELYFYDRARAKRYSNLNVLQID